MTPPYFISLHTLLLYFVLSCALSLPFVLFSSFFSFFLSLLFLSSFLFSQPRMDETVPVSGAVSRVLHIRNLPNDVTEGDVYMLISTFGAVSNPFL